MSKLEEFEKKLGSLAVELEVMKAEAAQDEERPNDTSKYWASDSYTRKVFESAGADARITKRRIATGNVHRTKEEAEAYRDWLTNPRTQARRRVEGYGGFDPIGGSRLAITGGEVIITEMNCNYGGLTFATEEQAQACLDLLGEDVIKLALGIG